MTTTAVAAEIEAIWFLDSLAEIRISRDEGEGRMSVVEMTVAEGRMPPLHVDDEDESFYLLDGYATFYVGDDVVSAGPGDAVLAPRGVPHTVRPEADARWLTVTQGAFERFVRTVGRPAEELAPPPAGGAPSPETAAFVARAAANHGIEILGPPGMLPSEL